MIDEQLARFEASLERLVESAFASFLGKRIRAQDIALQLARAMEGYARPAFSNDKRPVAPDVYIIRLSPQLHAQIIGRIGELQRVFSQHMVTLAGQAGYRLENVPTIQFEINPLLERAALEVSAQHAERRPNSTQHMQKVSLGEVKPPENLAATLLINARRVVRLDSAVMNIGRGHDNDVILDDPYVSRHHLQIRFRFGDYLLFDVDSQGGTRVNGVLVKEHRLCSGDVIELGESHLLFMYEQGQEDQLSQTEPLE